MPRDIADAIETLNADALDADGYTIVNGLLSPESGADLIARYDDDIFRSHIIMQRHAYGQGEYKYFRYPLPDIVAALREGLYPTLAEIANRWNAAMGLERRYPERHGDLIAQCHAAGQTRPTPLILRYGPGDYNRLHQDLYGDFHFPLQATVLLSEPERDFTGGEFLLTEQRPRVQSRGEVVPLARGDAVIFPVNQRPVAGARGTFRVTMRHGVSRVRSGSRHALGVIFHDAT